MADPKLKAFRNTLLYYAVQVLSLVIRRLPLGVSRFLGRGLGAVGYVVVRGERAKARHNIALALPELKAADRDRIIRSMFRHLGETLVEMLWIPNLDAQVIRQTTEISGFQPVQALLDQDRGVFVFTGHIGNWEWLASAMAGLGHRVSVLQRERDEPEMNRFITELRAHAGIQTIDRGSASSAKEMLQSMRRSGFLAFLIDQNIRAASVKVPFFGLPALTPIGPARMAIRTESPVVSVFIERRQGKQHIRFLPPIETKRGDDPILLTQRLTRDIENQIRRAPEQWVWMHDRWRERPKWDVTEKEKAARNPPPAEPPPPAT